VFVGPEQGVLVLGPPRSGKTSTIVVPNVLGAPAAVVSTSTKPDVLEATVGARRRAGQCWLYDPSGSTELPAGLAPLRWSPVRAARTWDGAVLMARALVRAARTGPRHPEESHWTERAEALLAPLLHAAALEHVDARGLVSWVNRRDLDPALDALATGGASLAVDLLAGVAATEHRELSGIWSTASGVLVGYRSEAALTTTEAPNFDADVFARSADTVYITATGRHQAVVAPLVVGLMEEIRAAAYASHTAHARHSAPATAAAPPVVLALDEVANIAPLPELPALVAEGGSQGLVTLACLQDLSQARARWGDLAEGFASLFGATAVLPGIGDVRTLRALSARAGDHDVPVRSQSRRRGGHDGESVTWSTRRQPRLGVDAIAEGRAGHALVIGGAEPPVWLALTPWWAGEPWRTLAAPERRRSERGASWWSRRPGRARARNDAGALGRG
jgi:type IV secretory pathway TraG/TraD family ATPase VirD4